MLLEKKVAVIHGGGGSIGGAVARVFAREGAKVFLAGRTLEKLNTVAREIWALGGAVETAQVDALDEEAVERHAADVAERAGGIDIALNAVGIVHVQGPLFAHLSYEDFAHPVLAYTRTNFLTAKAVARHMAERKSGVILTLTTPGSQLPGVGFTGIGVANGAVETLSRQLAGELGPSGIRVICLRSDAIPEAVPLSHTRQVFGGIAERMGMPIEKLLEGRAQGCTLLKRLPTLAQIAEFAAFVASERAGAMTGAIANLTCGSLVD